MIKQFLPILTTAPLSFLPTIAHAQTYQPSNRIPVADNSQIGTQVKNLGNNNFGIEGGSKRGSALFHSFTDFSVPTNGSANFTNPTGNALIITRVTGNLFSDLNGLIKTNGAGALLINYNGVVFGSGVKLEGGLVTITKRSDLDFFNDLSRNYFGVNKAIDVLYDASKQISQACGASQRDNKFYITGRGGLPPNASEPQESDALWSDPREVKAKPATTASLLPKYAPPAIGLVLESNGRARLIAAQTTGGLTGTKVVCPSK